MKLLNVGCGDCRHPAWINLDLVQAGPDVLKHDIREKLPFPESSFDAVYHSHVLEHLDPEEGEDLIRECHRVLRPGGVLRVVVPDLEAIARHYLDAVDRLRAGQSAAAADHRWMCLELFDQMVRSHSGGRMASALKDPSLPNRAYVEARMGEELRRAEAWSPEERVSRWRSLLRRSPAEIWWAVRGRAASTSVAILGGKEAQKAFREGWFRRRGEVHRWMYDEISLGLLLQQSGFCGVTRYSAHQSGIPEFAKFELDTISGQVRKPDSLFCEGIKPGPDDPRRRATAGDERA
jgi:predicted SAM-dependent methyltransferase